MSRRILKGTLITSALTLLSRVLGFIRDLVVARTFGAGSYADCFFVAYRIPNLLRSFVAEGALSAAFVPVFSSELAKGEGPAKNSLRLISGFLLLITLAITILGIFFSEPIVKLFAPGFSINQSALSTLLTQIMFPYIICVSFIALLNAALNTLHIYGTSAMAQCVMNLSLIVGGIIAAFLSPDLGVLILALSVLVGGVMQVIYQLPRLWRAGYSITPSISRNIAPGVISDLVRLMLPALVGATVYQLMIFLGTVFASLLERGSVSWLFYADRIVQLPIGIFSIALASVLLPTLSRAHAENNSNDFEKNFINSLRYTSFVILPIAAILFAYAEPLVRIVFERGAFNGNDTLKTALAIKAQAIGIWAISCHSMIMRAFMARKDTVTPTYIGFLSLLSNLVFALLFMGKIDPVFKGHFVQYLVGMQVFLIDIFPDSNLGHVGLALASSLSSSLAFLFAAVIFELKHQSTVWRPFIFSTSRTVVGAAVMILSAQNLIDYFGQSLIGVGFALVISVSIFTLIEWFLGSKELLELKELLRERLFSSKAN